MDAPSSEEQQKKQPTDERLSMKIFNHSSFVGTNVSNQPGGSIVIDQDALVLWSVDAMRVIRDQLYRAASGGGGKELPFVEHWPREREHFRAEANQSDADLPSWVRETGAESSGAGSQSTIAVSDMNQMSNEVSSLLQSIEIHLEQQRIRRLRRLCIPPPMQRNWYQIALGVPLGSYVAYKLLKKHGGIYLIKLCFSKVAEIYRDHVSEPANAIYRELFTKSGRIDVTDRKARIDAIESLKRMIRSWLDEYFPSMPEEEKASRAGKMDISLIEERFEESIKHIYEINSVVRMSLIEMQVSVIRFIVHPFPKSSHHHIIHAHLVYVLCALCLT